MNGNSLAEIQQEISDGVNITQIVGNLTQMIQRELSLSRRAGRQQANVINESVDARVSSHSPLRSALKQGGVKRDLSESFARAGNDKIEQLQRQMIEL